VRFARPRSRRGALHAFLAAALLALALPACGYADGFQRDTTPLPSSLTGSGSTAAASGGTSSGSGYARLFIGLAVVVALIFAVRWVARRANGSKLPGGTGKLSVIATTPIGPNRALHLVRVGRELVLVGSAEQCVSALRVYDADESLELETLLDPPEAFAALAPASARGWSAFVDELRKRTARR
jgi:flagellar protein FliO/FliZ